jgi:hypothetical protein
MKRTHIAATLALAVGGGCALDELEPDVGPLLAGACDESDSDPSVDVSFSRELRPLMNRPRGEAGCSCHTPTNGTPSGIALGGLSLGSVYSLRQGGFNTGTEIVVAGDPCASVLMHKISDTPGFGARMPLDGAPYLTPEEVQLFHDWIAEGALDN